jgi:hypothetical protein
VAALRVCLRRALTRIDAAAAAARLVKAIRNRQVRLDARDDGMSALTVLWATPVGRACQQALSDYAKACAVGEDGTPDPRTHQQRMTDCLADLILRPDADHPPVRVALTLIAGVDTLTGTGGGADEPGEVGGDLVPAAVDPRAGLHPRPAAPTRRHHPGRRHDPDRRHPDRRRHAGRRRQRGRRQPPRQPRRRLLLRRRFRRRAGRRRRPRGADRRAAGPQRAAADELRAAYAATNRLHEVGDDGGSATRAALTRLLDTRRLLDTALAERPRIAIVDQLTGTLLALTDSTGLRAAAAAGHGLGPPPGTAAYQPTDPLDRFVRLRDRRCRFPGCRTRARCCDLDHQVPHPHGPTAHDNLACLCEHHHRLSHQAPGWALHRDDDGNLMWTLPGGLSITTRPPAFGTDDGSTPTPPRRTGRQQYDDALAAIRNSRPAPPTADVPF